MVDEPNLAAEPKGRAAVEQALVGAAADLLAEVGPRNVGVRDIAQRAGVNHGQVHHYFGSKRGLLLAAMRQLATEHFTNATERAGGGAIPPPLTLAEDDRYWQAVIRTVLDGDLELATVEVADGVSVPQRALHALAAASGLAEADVELKANVAAVVALQLAWVALEPFVFAVTDVADDERHAVRARHRRPLRTARAPREVTQLRQSATNSVSQPPTPSVSHQHCIDLDQQLGLEQGGHP